ncbi:hypothetical protein FHS27_006486 [Rhodopirellula rubra]|uniref:Uncharacterized protein n=1 Tax=Aporhodopirellula rubra TaxID=980271 RepID=A0A7W5H9K2_9BACT|nr:hypothetical protein [Aporhodopirellula rubra]
MTYLLCLNDFGYTHNNGAGRVTWFLRKGLRHTYQLCRRGLALVQFLVVQTSLASFRAVS